MLPSNDDIIAMPTYRVESASVFNLLVLSCLKHVPLCLQHHIPTKVGVAGKNPSTHKAWPRVKKVIKPYLTDLVSLVTNLRDPSMQCAVIKNIRSLSRYLVCLPRLTKSVEKQLLGAWGCEDTHVQVMAFLALRDITLLRPHPSLTNTLKVQT